jgi:hypothetical protein
MQYDKSMADATRKTAVYAYAAVPPVDFWGNLSGPPSTEQFYRRLPAQTWPHTVGRDDGGSEQMEWSRH